MPPTPLRKRLTNEDKMKIIEESKQPGFCRKKTMDKYGIRMVFFYLKHSITWLAIE